MDQSTQFPAIPCFTVSSRDIRGDIKARGLPLANPPGELARALANIRRNPPSAVPEDIGPRMKGLTDERECIFALSVEFVSRGPAYLYCSRRTMGRLTHCNYKQISQSSVLAGVSSGQCGIRVVVGYESHDNQLKFEKSLF